MTSTSSMTQPSQHFEEESSKLVPFAELLNDVAGIDFPEFKRPMLLRRIGQRQKALGVESLDGYYERLTQGSDAAEELDSLIDTVLTNETSFFREQRQFDYLRDQHLPKLLEAARANRRETRCQVWSAACSTGEEAYSVAMLLEHELVVKGWSVEVLATDLSRSALATASMGRYPLEAAQNVPEEYLRAYALKGKKSQVGVFKIGSAVKSRCRFARVNLAQPPYPIDGKYDVILLRNVLMFWDLPTRRRVVEELVRYLNDDGLLLVGHAESLRTVTRRVQAIAPMIYAAAGSYTRPTDSVQARDEP